MSRNFRQKGRSKIWVEVTFFARKKYLKLVSQGNTVDLEVCDFRIGVEEECNTDTCLEFEWGAWSACSATCTTFGGGAQTRTRTATGCTCVELPGGGACANAGTTANTADCDAHLGSSTESEDCSPDLCQTWIWGEWSACSATCVGTRSRSNEGGCNTGTPADCDGQAETETEGCNTHACPEWIFPADFGACSVTCGTGSQAKLGFQRIQNWSLPIPSFSPILRN